MLARRLLARPMLRPAPRRTRALVLALASATLTLHTLSCQLPPSRADGGGAPPDRRPAPLDLPTALPDRGPGDAARREGGVDPALRQKIFDEVEAYLTIDDPGASPPLLAKLDGEYRDVPFALFAEAVRHRPATPRLPASGVAQASWTDPQYKGSEIYHHYVPTTLATSGRDRFPLVVFLHGAGGNGAAIAQDKGFQATADRLGAILVAPTANASGDWNESEDRMAQVVLLLRLLKRRLPVDDARVVLTGFSMGGRGSFSIGVDYMEPLAGLVPVAGAIGAVFDTPDLAKHKLYCAPHVENLRHVRLQYILGDQDMVQQLWQNRGCELALKELPDNEWIYSELKGQGHVFPPDLWEQAVTWTLGKPRPAYPQTVVYNIAIQAAAYLPGYFWPQQVLRRSHYWTQIESRVDETKPARLLATASAGQLALTPKNVKQVSLYLADELTDLGAPLTVLADGKAVFQGAVARDRALLLTEARRRGDRSMTFAARLQLTLP